jgi:hypothetical protein
MDFQRMKNLKIVIRTKNCLKEKILKMGACKQSKSSPHKENKKRKSASNIYLTLHLQQG